VVLEQLLPNLVQICVVVTEIDALMFQTFICAILDSLGEPYGTTHEGSFMVRTTGKNFVAIGYVFNKNLNFYVVQA